MRDPAGLHHPVAGAGAVDRRLPGRAGSGHRPGPGRDILQSYSRRALAFSLRHRQHRTIGRHKLLLGQPALRHSIQAPATACRCGATCPVAQGSASSDCRWLRLEPGSVSTKRRPPLDMRYAPSTDGTGTRRRPEKPPSSISVLGRSVRLLRLPGFAFIALFAGKAEAAYARSDLLEAACIGGGMVDLPRGLSRVEGASLAGPCGVARELSGRHWKPMLQRGTLRATIVPCGSGTRAFAP